MKDPMDSQAMAWNRRQFLGSGAGLLAWSWLQSAGASTTLSPHFPARAKHIIWLFMSGGPSQVDTWDPKPELDRLQGKDVPDSIASRVPKIKRAGLVNLMASPFTFDHFGQSGIPCSDLHPHTARHVDDICLLRSMTHRNPVHGPGECVALTGSGLGNRPSIGAWVTYGLGRATSNLPAFLAMNVHTTGMQYPQAAGWGASFLPPEAQGVVVDPSRGIEHAVPPSSFPPGKRRLQLDALKSLNEQHAATRPAFPEWQARIQSYEDAFRLQTAGPELFDLSRESPSLRASYGMDAKETAPMARCCLLARRMVERGVRFVQIRCGGWDAHGNLLGNHRQMAGRTDLPVAAMLTDLKQRGLLDETLVIWGGEFGRTPTMEGRANGRDHSPAAYTMWLAGGGAQGGRIIGETDPIGYTVTRDPIRPEDFHATLLASLGLDQHRVVHRHHGRDEIPTNLGGDVVSGVFS